MQVTVAIAALWQFVAGTSYFAYSDIGSDTQDQFIPMAVLLARELQQGWPSSWSFEVGVGAVTRLGTNPFLLLNAAFGPDAVPAMRVWVYMAKVLTGGAFLYMFLCMVGRRPLTSSIIALSYSFSGFIVVDGQWDPLAVEYAMYPMILVGLTDALSSKPRIWPLPIAIALAVYCAVFPFSIGIFLIYCLVASLITSDSRIDLLRRWTVVAFPLALLGLLLAAPQVISTAYQILDSPRVSGDQAGFVSRLTESIGLNNARTMFAQLAGLFHKDLLGVGSAHRGWMNYLEGPTYFIGLIPLVVIPQLWTGSRTDRRVLLAALCALLAIVVFPAARYLAFGFALPYFRVNNLWVSLMLLAVAARALDLVFDRGVSRLMLMVAVVTLGTALAISLSHFSTSVRAVHALALALAGGTAAGLLLASCYSQLVRARLDFLILAVTGVTALAFAYPSFNIGRIAATRQTLGFADPTLAALRFVRSQDPGIYRVEKSFDSVSYCDSLVQGYMGIKSYWFHGSSIARFYTALELFPVRRRQVNYTNWLPNFGDRFPLYSLFGVKYFISRTPISWPGFRQRETVDGLRVYENTAALPLGVVYTRQLPREVFEKLSVPLRDSVLLRAAIVDQPVPELEVLQSTGSGLTPASTQSESTYLDDANLLRRRGLSVTSFSNDRVSGTVNSDQHGLLVFSVPYSRGWAIMVDGELAVPRIANLGMLAVELSRGSHQIELIYSPPGRTLGFALTFLALTTLTILALRGRLTREPRDVPHPVSETC
jgi:uncharacterized membrane protein YfhO